MAEWSKALVLGTSLNGRGFESHRCHENNRYILSDNRDTGSFGSKDTILRFIYRINLLLVSLPLECFLFASFPKMYHSDILRHAAHVSDVPNRC